MTFHLWKLAVHAIANNNTKLGSNENTSTHEILFYVQKCYTPLGSDDFQNHT